MKITNNHITNLYYQIFDNLDDYFEYLHDLINDAKINYNTKVLNNIKNNELCKSEIKKFNTLFEFFTLNKSALNSNQIRMLEYYINELQMLINTLEYNKKYSDYLIRNSKRY